MVIIDAKQHAGMTKDLYVDFADRYDLFLGGFGKHDPVYSNFFKKIFDENGIHSVLDCACGTGNDLHLFHSLGYDIVGSDISESMLAQAKKNLANCGVKIPMHKADYRTLPQHFNRKFDAVVCLSSSILHMANKNQVLRAFRSMRRVIRDKGVLVLTQGTTDKQWKKKPRFILATNTKNFSRLFVIDYKKRGARYNVLDIYHGDKNSELKVWSVDYPQMLLKDDQQKLLRLSGFRKIDFFGSYRFEPYSKKTSDMLIAVAYK